MLHALVTTFPIVGLRFMTFPIVGLRFMDGHRFWAPEIHGWMVLNFGYHSLYTYLY